MTYDEALEYIHGVSWTFCKPGLERISELCRALGHPEDKLRFVHVAGTNGKGSFCSMLDSVLRAAGYRVGLYTSPYILEFGERMRVDGKNIAPEVLAEITERVKPIADAMEDKPTEFELITAIAFEFFASAGVDVVILEAGLGGRLDSTNVIKDPLLSVITGIALDHTAILGDTVAAIAREKAGIIKDGAPVLFGGEDEDAEAVIREVASERGSKFFKVDYAALAICNFSLGGSIFTYKNFHNAKIKLLGEYQPRNASIVIDAVNILRSRGLKIDDDAIYEGLSKAEWHARFEILSENPLVIFDGAHNPQGIESAVKSIESYFGKRKVFAITGVLADKDYQRIATSLARIAERAYTMTPDNPRALSAEIWAEVLALRGVETYPKGSIGEAVTAAIEEAEEANTPVVCLGSLYTYGDVVAAIKKK